MKLSELCPFPVFLNWDGTNIELKPFSLRAITWAERFFFNGEMDGFERMYHILSNEEGIDIYFNSVIDIVFYLSHEGFEDIGISSPCSLKKIINESNEKWEIIKEFKEALEDVLENSFPQKKEFETEQQLTGGSIFEFIKKQEEELKKKNTKKINNENWEQIYIDFYRDGGMTIDQFMDLTKKQIYILYPELIYKQLLDYEKAVTANGRKLQQKPTRKLVS